MLACIPVESGFGLGEVRRVPGVAQCGLVAAQKDDGHLATRYPADRVEDAQHRWVVGVGRCLRRWGAPESVHVVTGGDNGMGLFPAFVVEVASVAFQCRQQCHHLTEDLLIGFCELREPPFEQRVVTDLHVMHFTTYECDHISGNLVGDPLRGTGPGSEAFAAARHA